MISIFFPKTYVIYDLETTGLDPRNDEANEIGVMKVVSGEIVEERSVAVGVSQGHLLQLPNRRDQRNDR